MGTVGTVGILPEMGFTVRPGMIPAVNTPDLIVILEDGITRIPQAMVRADTQRPVLD